MIFRKPKIIRHLHLRFETHAVIMLLTSIVYSLQASSLKVLKHNRLGYEDEPVATSTLHSRRGNKTSSSHKSESKRIINGTDAEAGKYPFVGVVYIRNEQKCGASLLTPSSAITACHCLVENPSVPWGKDPKLRKPSSVQVLFGELDLNIDTFLGEMRRARRVSVHPKCAYNFTNVVHDYGMIQFLQPANLYPGFVELISLPDFQKTSLIDGMIKDEVPCVIIGWGVMNAETQDLSPTLKEISSTLRHQDWCAQNVFEFSKNSKNGADRYLYNHICASGDGRNQSACSGDSGGPLLCGRGEKKLIGVLSYVPGTGSCGLDKIPTVSARLDMVTDWIYSTWDEEDSYSLACSSPSKLVLFTGSMVLPLCKYISAAM